MESIASHWHRQLAAGGKPAYLAIADLIAEDLKSGRLTAGDQLPTLRELAEDLGLNYTTVARAYTEARKRGLIEARPGAGSFVRGRAPSLPLRAGSDLEMTMNLPPEPREASLIQRLKACAATVCARQDLFDLLRYQDFGGTPAEREIAAEWVRSWVPDVSGERLLVAPGIHAALVGLLSQLARPGETVCVEALTYPGIKAIATQLGINLHPLPLDEDGPSAAAFEEACKRLQPRALHVNPVMRNPDTGTTRRARREALADVALRYNVPIIEDDAYGMLPRQRPPAFAMLAPELTYYITGFSKFLGAGLRTAFVVAPSVRQIQRLAGTLRAMTVMSSPVTTAIVTQAIADGTAAAMQAAVRHESQARQALAAKHLAGYAYRAQAEGFHLWLPVPPSWSMVELASYLRTKGVGAVASVAFATDGSPPQAIRLCLGGPAGREECEAVLSLVADTLDHPVHPHATAV